MPCTQGWQKIQIFLFLWYLFSSTLKYDCSFYSIFSKLISSLMSSFMVCFPDSYLLFLRCTSSDFSKSYLKRDAQNWTVFFRWSSINAESICFCRLEIILQLMQPNIALCINHNTLLKGIQLLINHIYNTDFTEGRRRA